MLFCIETVLVLTSIYVMWNAITFILLGIFHFDWVVVQLQMWKTPLAVNVQLKNKGVL